MFEEEASLHVPRVWRYQLSCSVTGAGDHHHVVVGEREGEDLFGVDLGLIDVGLGLYVKGGHASLVSRDVNLLI